MDDQYVLEEIKQKYKMSNKYMLCVTYEDIGILIDIIEVLDKQLKFRKVENKKMEAQRGQLMMLNKAYIPKSKVEEEIDKLNKKEKDLQNSINDEEREEYSDANISFDLMDIDIRRETLQSLLGKE